MLETFCYNGRWHYKALKRGGQMDQDQGVGREVKRLREAKGWSQTRLAAEADMSVSGISMIENGHRNLSTTTLARLAEALGVEVVDLFPKPQAPQPSLEDAAQSEAFQHALIVLFRGLARRGQGIIEQSLREGPSEALSRELTEYYDEAAALHRIKGRRDIFGRDSDELAEAEAAYQEVADRIEAMLRQDIDASEDERRVARRFKAKGESYKIEERQADVS
jgi:transcriptional regulator with XRE-family HTH domain